MIINTEKLLKTLKTSLVRVEFRKINGEIRIMYCTLDPHSIPLDKRPKSIKEELKENNAITVFDTYIGEWRSFRKDSVISYWMV